ncbi:hypothetical protein DOY81_014436, partial [Sarcophaga bullata]
LWMYSSTLSNYKDLGVYQANSSFLKYLQIDLIEKIILSATVSYNSEPVSPLASATGISGSERCAAVLAL